ncbi:hypothetical protein [Streptomyces narbonensis]
MAVFAGVSATEDMAYRLLGIAHAALLVVALRRPLPAWWLSLVTLPLFSLHPPLAPYLGWAWAVHAGLLFLLALRNPPRVMAETVTASTVSLLAVEVAVGGACPPPPPCRRDRGAPDA